MVLKKREALASLKLLYRLVAPFPGPVTKLYKESLAPTALNHSPTHVPVVVKRMVFPLTSLPPM